MDWLGGRLCYRMPEDWYAVRKRDFQANYGGGMLARIYGDSPIAAVKEYLGDFELHPWFFTSVPKGFWEDRANRLAYMNWLGKQLNYQAPQDWYGIKKSHFQENSGGGLLGSIYNHSPQCAVAELFPNFQFLPWMFTTVPQGYWQHTDNRLAFLIWLGEKKNVQSFADWQRLKRSDFKENGGAGLLNSYYDDSPEKAIQEYLANRPETEE